MRFAVIIDNIILVEINNKLKVVMLFDINEDIVVAIDKELISITNINYLCLWLLSKKVSRLYCNEITDCGKKILNKAGIEVFPLKSIKEHPIVRALLWNI